MPAAIVLVKDARSQADSLASRLVVVNKLDLSASRLAVSHTRARRDAHDNLLVERATDRAVGQFVDQGSGRAKGSSFGACHVLAIGKKSPRRAGPVLTAPH